jgi:hypothetical protein
VAGSNGNIRNTHLLACGVYQAVGYSSAFL